MISVDHSNPIESFEVLETQDFVSLGLNIVAYIKPVADSKGQGFSIHAADGSVLSTAKSRDLALASVRSNDLEPLSVH